MKNLFQVVFGTQGAVAQKAFRLPALAGIGAVLAVLLLAGCSTGNYDNVSPIAGTYRANCVIEEKAVTGVSDGGPTTSNVPVTYPLTLTVDNATWTLSGVPIANEKTKFSLSGWYEFNSTTEKYDLHAKVPAIVEYLDKSKFPAGEKVVDTYSFSSGTIDLTKNSSDILTGGLDVNITTSRIKTGGQSPITSAATVKIGATVGATANDGKFARVK